MVDCTKFCRICVLQHENLVDVNQTFESNDKKSTLRNIFNECSPAKIKKDDPYPQQLCISCLSDLLKCYEFRQKCLKSIDLLSSRLLKVVEQTSVPQKRKIKEEEPGPSCSKVVKKRAGSTDFENVISKNEIYFQSSSDEDDVQYESSGYELEEEDEGTDDDINPVASTSKIEPDVKQEATVIEGDVGRMKILQAEGVAERIVLSTAKAKPIGEFKKVVKVDGNSEMVFVAPASGKTLPPPEIAANKSDLGEFKITILSGYKNSSHVVYEANGFLYVNTRNTPSRRYLRCSTCKNCPGKACIDIKPHDEVESHMYVYKSHNHPKETLHISKLRLLESMREIASSGNYTPKQVYAKAMKDFPALRNLMPYTTLASRLYRLSGTSSQCKSMVSLPKFAKYMTDVKPNKYSYTQRSQKFFQEALIDEENETCAIIYANTQLIESMSWSNELFIDSSFRIAFDNDCNYTFLTISIAVNDHRFPVYFVVMDTATQESYTKVLLLFRDKYAPSLHPEEIVTDFNADLFKSLTDVYKHATISGSLVHYIFYVYKQCNVEDIIKQIEVKSECMKIQSYLFALPILPPQLIPAGLKYIKTNAAEVEAFTVYKRIFDYIEETWIHEVSPQVFSTFCNMRSVSESIFNTFKKIRDVISSKKKFGFFDLNEKLIVIEDWVATTYEKVLAGEKLPRQASSSKHAKVLDKLWQPGQLDKTSFETFFENVGPLIDKLTGLIWIWGFYNYDGLNNEQLITAADYFGSDIEEHVYEEQEEEEEGEDEEEAEDEPAEGPKVELEEDGQLITFQLVKDGDIILQVD